MKKILSAVLAAAMIASMGAVAFAAQPDPGTGAADTEWGAALGSDLHTGGEFKLGKPDNGKAPTVKVDDNKAYFPVVGIKGPYGYYNDDKVLFNSGKDIPTGHNIYTAPIEYGDTAYYALIQWMPEELKTGTSITSTLEKLDGVKVDDTASTNSFANLEGYYTVVTESETVSSLKIKQDWEEGKDLVKSVSIVKKKVCNNEDWDDDPNFEYSGDSSTDDTDMPYPGYVDLGLDIFGLEKDMYCYFLAIKYEDSTSVNDTDVCGTLTLSKSKDPSVEKIDIDVEVNVDWENSWRPSSMTNPDEWEVTGDITLKADKNYALKFNADDEVTIEFDDDSYFEVDVSGQSKLLFNYNTEYISRIAAKYPYAELNFWNGNGAKFNRVGQMFLSCEDLTGTQFLYQVTSDGKLAEVPGAEWDDSDEGFYFNTRVLGSYVISDMELEVAEEEPANNNSSATVVTPAPITNPSTGAIA